MRISALASALVVCSFGPLHAGERIAVEGTAMLIFTQN